MSRPDPMEPDEIGFPGNLEPEQFPLFLERRERLLQQIETPCQARVTLMVASPGYGKTTLARDWAS